MNFIKNTSKSTAQHCNYRRKQIKPLGDEKRQFRLKIGINWNTKRLKLYGPLNEKQCYFREHLLA